MQKRLNHFMLLFVMIAVVITSAVRTTSVYADDGGTEPPTGESTPPPAEGETSVEETTPTAEPTAEESVVATEVPAVEPPVEEPTPVVEVLEQLPEDTEVIVLNDKGSPEPLVTLDAAEIVQSGDPRYTVAGTTYYFMPIGGCGALANCVESATPIQTALDYLNGTNAASLWVGIGATPDDGTVYIDAGIYTENVAIDGNTGWNAGGNKPVSLTLSGAGSTTTTLNGSLSITNMNIFTLSGLTIVDADSVYDTALNVSNNTGTLTLTDVRVTNNLGDGASLRGTGDVNISNSQFNDSSLTGLLIDTTGTATLNNVQANSNGYGLDIIADAGINLTGVTAASNSYFGGILDTTYGTGAITITSSNFGVDAATGNGWTGLHAVSGGAITLNNVTASYNGTNGAYLLATGAIEVNNSTFNNNVQFNYPEDPGLFALSDGGNITLDNVNANGNVYGAGVVLGTYGAGVVNINGGQFNDNGTFGVQANTESGDMTLNGITASYNGIKGAYLHSSWLGNISISNSTFVENGTFGIFAATADGDITANNVTVIGNHVTVYGANLATATGNVTVSNSTFTLNQDVGIDVVAGNQVTLTNVNADHNGGTDVEVFSISTGEPICEGEPVVNILVQVNGGSFTYSGGYGLMVKPGPQGTLTFGSPAATFGNNGWGDYLLDLSNATFKDCTPKPEEPETKGPLIVDIPSTGGPSVEQDCDQYTGTILKLPNGAWVEVGCPFDGFSRLEELTKENLPGPLEEGLTLEMAIALGLVDADGKVILNDDGTVTINFIIPEDARSRHHSVLFWDAALNDGKGGWMQLPPYEIGTSFPLNPKDPNDLRTILSGVQEVGNTVTVTVNFSGVFALVSR